MFPKTVTLLLLLNLLVSFVAGLSTSGNKIVDSNGKPVLLRGVCRPSFEWNVNGESASLADYRLMASWGANVVRLSLNQDFWLSGASTYNPNYATIIDQQVAWIKQAGMYCILDLHWSDQGNLGNSGGQQVMADANSVTFWTQVAGRYANDSSILFELYNEPHDVSWSIWQKGGSSGGFQVYGMQQLYNAVRSRANNIVIIGGLGWAFDLSGVANYPITGTNIVYATHPYDYSGKQAGDWDAAFGYLAATYPVIMTEFGQYCATNTYVSDLLKYAAAKGIHWTAWAWYVNGCSFPSIINDWNGTPSSVGATVKSFLQSSGTPSTSSSSSTTGVPQSSSSQVVYDDQLQNGWQDWSWATVSKTSTSPVYAGSYSFSFAITNYAGLYLHTPTPFYIGTYASLQFYVNGGSSNPTQIIVKVYDTSSSPATIGNAVSLPASVVANKWVLETIPFSAFGLATTTQISGFVVQYNQADNGGTIYLDNISLVSSSTSTTTKSSTSTAASATSAASGATSTASGATSTASGATSTASGATTAASGATSAASGSTSTASGATGGAAASTSSAAASTSSVAASTSAVSASTSSVAASTSASATTTRSTSGTSTGSSTGSAAVGCSVSSVSFTQTLVNQWPSNGATIMQFSTSISHTCSSKQLVGLTLQPSNWNPVNYWNLQASGSQLVLPPSTSISSSSPYTSFGYQNPGTATFTIVAATFQ